MILVLCCHVTVGTIFPRARGGTLWLLRKTKRSNIDQWTKIDIQIDITKVVYFIFVRFDSLFILIENIFAVNMFLCNAFNSTCLPLKHSEAPVFGVTSAGMDNVLVYVEEQTASWCPWISAEHRDNNVNALYQQRNSSSSCALELKRLTFVY